MKKYQLLVVTVTYNPDIEELILFIISFRRYNDLGDNAKLIIVDNSPDNLWSKEEFMGNNDDVDIISNPSNPGFGASNNLGFKKYCSDYVLFINNDVEFIEPIFRQLIKIHETDDNLGCIGIYQNGGSPSFFRKFDAPSNIANSKFIDKYHFISGSFMFFKSSIFKECGGFDENIFMYLEEYDISVRLINKGYYTVYCPQYSFLHKTKNRKLVNRRLWVVGMESYLYVCMKYGIDPKKYFSSNHLYKLLVYQLIKINYKQVGEIIRIIIIRKKMLQECTSKFSVV